MITIYHILKAIGAIYITYRLIQNEKRYTKYKSTHPQHQKKEIPIHIRTTPMDTKPNSLLHNPTHNPILLTHPQTKQITNIITYL